VPCESGAEPRSPSPTDLSRPATEGVAVIPLQMDATGIKEDMERESRARMGLISASAHYSAEPVRYTPQETQPPPPPPQQQQHWAQETYSTQQTDPHAYECEEYYSYAAAYGSDRPLDFSSQRDPEVYNTYCDSAQRLYDYHTPSGSGQPPPHGFPSQGGSHGPPRTMPMYSPGQYSGPSGGHSYPPSHPHLGGSSTHSSNVVLTPSQAPPSQHDVRQGMMQHGLGEEQYIEAYYTKPQDMAEHRR
jgi:hypothetical protein